ncbi:MAG: inorganic pyrophosphatase [Planctomycetales bacterium]|nr:inorganic pyrophosphatase [Planctomycetales bacterium]
MTFPKPFYRWRPHPWHGLDVGPQPPSLVHAYIEITPFDLVKYELDKRTGYLRVDRPARTSSLPPSLYGFIPRTYCGQAVGALRDAHVRGDQDPLDICVVTERPINRAEVILNAKVIGGLPMLDHGEADDKILAVLSNDNLWSDIQDVSELPVAYVDRLRHYFSTYKQLPGERANIEIGDVYGRERAEAVVRASIEDYESEFGG